MCTLLISPALAQQAQTTAPAGAPADAPAGNAGRRQGEGETYVLSPFEVKSDTRGYYSSNSMSGTRFNTKIEDMGSSISIMTKGQMSDFAMLDINDIFLYTAGAEGAGTYTDVVVDRNGQLSDNVQLSPTTANRIRGIGSANISYNNYEMTGRMPIDPILVDAIEVSRGPNANVFGLGNAAGTVNQVGTSANLQKNRYWTEFRADSYDGWRAALDVNQTIIKDKLAIRASGAWGHEGFVRKPSGVDTERYNAWVKYQPFKKTTISAGVLSYDMEGNRPNFTPPRDYVTDWLLAGKATWDPVLQQVHVNGQTYGKYTADTTIPAGGQGLNALGLSRAGAMQTRANLYIGPNGVAYWTAPNTNSVTVAVPTPTANNQTVRLMQSSVNLGNATAAPGRYTNQPLWTTTPSVSDKSIYDWSDINVSSPNHLKDQTVVYTAQLDQIIIDTERQLLAVQLGALREENDRETRTPLGNSGTSGQSGQLFVDVNERNLDGTVNPFFGQTYLAAGEPLTRSLPADWNTYRAQAAYRLDLSHESGFLKWLGVQQLSPYYEYKERTNRAYSYREAMSSSPSWLSTVTTANYGRANQGSVSGGPQAGPNILRQYIRYYVGGNQNGHIDRAPSSVNFGSFPFHWGGYTTVPTTPVGAAPTGPIFSQNSETLALLATTDSTGGVNNLYQIIKTAGGVIQSRFLDDKLITMFGYRKDQVYSKNGVLPGLLNNNTEHDFARDEQWAAGDYRYNEGPTQTFSVVARPFRDIHALNESADRKSGAASFFADMIRNLALTYNQSDNFIPQAPAVDLFLKPLPNVTGEGEDYGFWLPIMDGKFVLRFNKWKTNQFNARDGDANTIAQRVLRKDVLYSTGSVDAWNLPFLIAGAWNTAGLSGPALEARIEAITKIPTATSQALANAFMAGTIAATNDIKAKGTEIELNYNPTNYWTIAASATETESISSNMSKTVQDWIDLRMPVWTTIVDPTSPTGALWWNTTYGSNTPSANHLVFVEAPYSVFKQQEGKSKPSVRRYAFKGSTSFSFAGVTDNNILKGIKIGGAVRWEDRGAIGYYGVDYKAKLAANQPITELDADNPIWDGEHWYFDAFVSYKTKMWADKVIATFQFNVRNLTEDGRLQPIGAFPDGTPNAFRIVDPRQYFLTVNFEM